MDLEGGGGGGCTSSCLIFQSSARINQSLEPVPSFFNIPVFAPDSVQSKMKLMCIWTIRDYWPSLLFQIDVSMIAN